MPSLAISWPFSQSDDQNSCNAHNCTPPQGSQPVQINNSTQSRPSNYPSEGESHSGHKLESRPKPSQSGRYLLQVSEGDRSWAFPVAWTKAELLALRMVARNSIYALDLSLPPDGPPVDVGKLHQLIEQLFPAVVRVAAMATAMAQEVAA